MSVRCTNLDYRQRGKVIKIQFILRKNNVYNKAAYINIIVNKGKLCIVLYNKRLRVFSFGFSFERAHFTIASSYISMA